MNYYSEFKASMSYTESKDRTAKGKDKSEKPGARKMAQWLQCGPLSFEDDRSDTLSGRSQVSLTRASI